jgi:hypothetical protein
MKKCQLPDPSWSLDDATTEELTEYVDTEHLGRATESSEVLMQIEEIRASDQQILSFLDAEKLAYAMKLDNGDVFIYGDDPQKVMAVDSRMAPNDRDSLLLTDPTTSKVTDGGVHVPLWNVFKSWKQGDVSPGRLEVVAK